MIEPPIVRATLPDTETPLVVESVEVYRSHVRVEWRSDGTADVIEPEDEDEDDREHHPITVTDDLGTLYELRDAHTRYDVPTPRGTCLFEPGPPETAHALSVSYAEHTFELSLVERLT